MEQLNQYIAQARQAGQTDEQIRQALIEGGWGAPQVDTALWAAPAPTPPAYGVPIVGREETPSPLPVQPTPVKLRPKLPLLAVGLVVLLVVVVVSAYVISNRKTSYQVVIQNFITAIQKKDKAKADVLESPASKALTKKTAGNSSFYEVCQKSGKLCTPFFSASFINNATKIYKDYKSPNGVKGKEIVYALKQLTGTSGCTSKSISTLTISAIPVGHSWLVDSVNPGFSFEADACSTSGSSNSAPTVASINTANTDIQAIKSQLEAYFSQNGYYPNDIAYSNFSSFGADQATFNVPQGIQFVYDPLPSGCTTDAQDCQHYTLGANDISGNTVTIPVQSDN